ncbi:hypothetical protein DFH08DRAFT_1079211 [Mycena albidolilacea]|uniref:Uncharacterized protein n=1 Tax=Mycena albidolilacea TaxID=1033008 RepID=A0AAD7A5L2_9AGAR|nr:hypothetical protein DFH08DRAFT_1079211 [Mycena albidolilacea]
MKFSTTIILAVSMVMRASAASIARRSLVTPETNPNVTYVSKRSAAEGRGLFGAIDPFLANQPEPTPAFDLGDIPIGHLPELPPTRRLLATLLQSPFLQGAIDSLLANQPQPTSVSPDLANIPIGHLPGLPPNGNPFDPNAVVNPIPTPSPDNAAAVPTAPPTTAPARRLFGAIIDDKLSSLLASQPQPMPVFDLGNIPIGHLPELPPARRGGV